MESDINFLYETGSHRHISRAWKQVLGMPVENVLEHTVRMMLIALVIARGEGVKNEEKIMKMVLLHDLGEARTLDSAFIHKEYVERFTEKAEHDQLVGTVFEPELALLDEYNKRESIEAKIVKDTDHLEVDVGLKELAKAGSATAIKMQVDRKKIRDSKLQTETAKKFWDKLQTIDPDDWQMVMTSGWIKKLK